MPGPQVSHGRALAERCRAGHARPLPGCSRRREPPRDAYMRPLQPLRERPGRVQVRKHCRGRACPARRCPMGGRLRKGAGPGMPGPYRGARGGANLPGTHICVPYKLSGNVRVVYRCGNTVGAGHARPAGVPWAGACGKVQGRACPAPTGRLAAAETSREG